MAGFLSTSLGQFAGVQNLRRHDWCLSVPRKERRVLGLAGQLALENVRHHEPKPIEIEGFRGTCGNGSCREFPQNPTLYRADHLVKTLSPVMILLWGAGQTFAKLGLEKGCPRFYAVVSRWLFASPDLDSIKFISTLIY